MSKEKKNAAQIVGLDLYMAKKQILKDFPELTENKIDITYKESDYPRFMVLSSQYDEKRDIISLTVSSNNPIRHLPSNYQSNDFLREFLMVFQHIMNDTSVTLDNMHYYFRPMDAPESFLPKLASWLGIHLDTLGGDFEIRRFLQNAIPFYRYRGTVIGLRALLSIVAGITPTIVEGKRPYTSMVIDNESGIEASMFETQDESDCFTIHFPVPRSHFDDGLLQRISRIAQREKPVHTKAYISFKVEEIKRRKMTVMNADSSMNVDGVIFI